MTTWTTANEHHDYCNRPKSQAPVGTKIMQDRYESHLSKVSQMLGESDTNIAEWKTGFEPF